MDITIYGANIVAGLSGQKFERSKVGSRRQVLPLTGAVSKHNTGSVTKQTTGAVSKHETGTMTKQTAGARGGFVGAVSKHETGTVK